MRVTGGATFGGGRVAEALGQLEPACQEVVLVLRLLCATASATYLKWAFSSFTPSGSLLRSRVLDHPAYGVISSFRVADLLEGNAVHGAGNGRRCAWP